MNNLILQAFLEVRNGKSADAVIADPVLDIKFIEVCRARGAIGTAFEFNHCLYSLRKRRALEDYPTVNRTRLRGQDKYRFAVEIAVRYLERRENTTLDRIICEPKLAGQFDVFASDIAPGFSSFEYRFTALSLRKKKGLKPEIVSRIIAATQVKAFRVDSLNIDQIPKQQGVYILYYKKHGVLYVGEAVALRNRIRQHIDHSDRKELARWLWEYGKDDLYVEIHVLPEGTAPIVRKAVERELIKSRKPRFNISGIEPEES